ncbi:MAG TPA: hypothetical protein ENK43_15670, partial [Planctomycetes bacterium]|nr:hypothetical protein [Planctomycetota bacterium]
MDGTYMCIKDCQAVTPFNVQIRIGAPIADPNGACDQFQATLAVVPLAPGTQPTIVVPPGLFLMMKYSRTWIETDSLGNQRQIWRFIVNSQLRFATTDTQPCPQPPCANVIGLSGMSIQDPWFHGIIEYASEIIDGGGGKGAPENAGDCVA